MEPELAREILRFAKARESYEADVPGDDDMAVSEAEKLVQHAWTAWSKNRARGPEVEGVLRLADEHFDGSDGDKSDGDGHHDTDTLTEPVTAPDDTPVEHPAVTQSHEFPAPVETAPAPQPEFPVPEEYLTNQEPWTGYDSDTVPVIKDALDAALAEDDSASILQHVYAYETANKGRVRIIKHLNEIAGPFEDDAVEEQAPEPAEAVAAPVEPVQAISGGEQAPIDYSDLIAEVEAEIASERLHVPEPPADAAPVLPYDYSRISDGEIRELHGAFGAYAYYADTRVQLHERIAQRARNQADEIAVGLLAAAANYDAKGKERRMSQIEAEIESTPAIAGLRAIQKRHEVLAVSHRRERDSYKNTVEFLSRQESMRHNEWQRGQK